MWGLLEVSELLGGGRGVAEVAAMGVGHGTTGMVIGTGMEKAGSDGALVSRTALLAWPTAAAVEWEEPDGMTAMPKLDVKPWVGPGVRPEVRPEVKPGFRPGFRLDVSSGV